MAWRIAWRMVGRIVWWPVPTLLLRSLSWKGFAAIQPGTGLKFGSVSKEKQSLRRGGQRAKCGKGEVIVMPAAAQTFFVAPASRCVFLRSFQPDLEADIRVPLRAHGFSEQQLQAMCFPEPPALSGEMT